MCVTAAIRVRGPAGAREFVEQQLAAVVHRGHDEPRAGRLARQLPRHDVGVVLHGGDEHLVARPQPGPGERVRDQVDRLGGVAGEDDPARVWRAEERRSRPRAASIGVGRQLAQLVNASMDVRVVAGVVAGDRVDDGARLLRRGGVVEVHEAAPADGPPEDREVGADALHVERRAHAGRHRPPSASARSRASCSKSSASSASRSGSICTRSRTSPANAWISMSRASANVSPRARR